MFVRKRSSFLQDDKYNLGDIMKAKLGSPTKFKPEISGA